MRGKTIGNDSKASAGSGESISAIARDLGVIAQHGQTGAALGGRAVLSTGAPSQPRPKLESVPRDAGGVARGRDENCLSRASSARRRSGIYEALCLKGLHGRGRARVRRQMRAFDRRRVSSGGGFHPAIFLRRGEAYQFDFSHEHVELGGIDQVVKLAHLRLAHSRAFFLIAYPRESQEMVFDAQRPGVRVLGRRAPRRGIYDNLKPAVDAIFTGKERRYNRRFLVMCNHYLIDPTACTPASWLGEVGQVENQVGNVREWLFTPKVRCADLAELNAHLAARCLQLARERPPSGANEPQGHRSLGGGTRGVACDAGALFDGYAGKTPLVSPRRAW